MEGKKWVEERRREGWEEEKVKKRQEGGGREGGGEREKGEEETHKTGKGGIPPYAFSSAWEWEFHCMGMCILTLTEVSGR